MAQYHEHPAPAALHPKTAGRAALLLGCSLIIFLAPAFAGNRKMMEKMGNNLIKLNNEVIRQLTDTEQNARISFKAKIIQGPTAGQHVIVIEEAEIVPMDGTVRDEGSSGGSTGFPEESAADYESYVSYQPLDIPDVRAESGIDTDTAARLATDRDIGTLLKQHPDARVMEIHQDSLDAIDWKDNRKPERAFLLFW